MTEEERDDLLADLRDAADDFREAERHLGEVEAEARVAGLTEAEIAEAHGLWLR